MLYSTLVQPSTFFNLSAFGFLAGVVFFIFIFLIKKVSKFRLLNYFLHFFAYLFAFFCFFLSNLIFNFGEYRLFSFVAFFVSFFISNFFASKILCDFVFRWYNKTKVKIDEKVGNTKKI